ERMKIELKLLQHQFDTTFVYITHDQSEALVMSDRVAVMNGGRFEQIGTPQELYHAPATGFVAGFVGDSNRWRGRVRGGGELLEGETGDGVRLRCRPGAGALAEGAAVEVFVRPEALSLQPAGAPEAEGPAHSPANRLEGRVDSLLFNGAASRVLVRGAGDQLVEVGHVPGPGVPELRPGDAVVLGFAPAEATCFAAASA
ncbi:MAG: TOBE domain-containing protein, partial [Tistlia sp.]